EMDDEDEEVEEVGLEMEDEDDMDESMEEEEEEEEEVTVVLDSYNGDLMSDGLEVGAFVEIAVVKDEAVEEYMSALLQEIEEEEDLEAEYDTWNKPIEPISTDDLVDDGADGIEPTFPAAVIMHHLDEPTLDPSKVASAIY
ncbi:hypothetical protein HK101_003163, partial [Irineochytrium annulatum]